MSIFANQWCLQIIFGGNKQRNENFWKEKRRAFFVVFFSSVCNAVYLQTRLWAKPSSHFWCAISFRKFRFPFCSQQPLPSRRSQASLPHTAGLTDCSRSPGCGILTLAGRAQLWCKWAPLHSSQPSCFLLHQGLIWSWMFRSLSYPLWLSNSPVERLLSDCECQ